MLTGKTVKIKPAQCVLQQYLQLTASVILKKQTPTF